MFDGPPTQHGPHLVEIEDDTGHSITIGEWIDRGDTFWALRNSLPARAERVVPSRLPAPFVPMLATAGSVPSGVAGWSFEFKWDGVRGLVAVDPDGRPLPPILGSR